MLLSLLSKDEDRGHGFVSDHGIIHDIHYPVNEKFVYHFIY